MRRALAAAAVAVLAALLPASGASASQGAPTLRLVEQTAWSATDGELRVRLRADDLPGDPAGLELALTVYGRVTSRSAFVATLGGEQLGSPVALVTRPWPELDPDGNGTVETVLDLGPDGVVAPVPGVHPVAVDLRRAGPGEVLARMVTHLVVEPGDDDESPPLLVALTLPFRAPPALQPDGTTALSEEAEGALATVAAALDAHRDVPVTLAPTPETVDALAGGTDAQVAVLETLRGAMGGRQVLGRPYVDLDLAAWTAAGLDAEVRAELTRGTDVVADQLPVRPDARTWIAGPSVSTGTLAGLRDLGVDQVVVPEETLEPLDASQFNRTLTSPFEVTGATDRTQRAVVADRGLAAHFTAGDDPVLAAHHLLADLAVLFFDAPGTQRGVAVVAPETWQPDAAFLDTLLGGLEAGDRVARPVTVDDVFADVPPAVGPDGRPLVRSLVPAQEPPSMAGYADRIRLSRLALIAYRSMTGPANPRFDDLERRLLVSGSEALTPEQRDEYIDAVVAAVDRETSAVELPGHRTITLTARQGTLPLTIRNQAGYPVEVTVRLDSDNKLEFPDGEVIALDLPAGTTRLEVVVRSRASGTSRVEVRLTSPDGVLALGDTRVTVRSTAVSGVGIVLSAGALLFLLVWWARHWRTARRQRRLVPEPAEPGERLAL